MQVVDIVIRNGLVLAMDGRGAVENEVACLDSIVIHEGKIIRICAQDELNGQYEGKKIIDAQGGIVMPGLVNTHTHAGMTLFRGLADDLSLMAWLNDYIFKAEARWLSADTVYKAARLACAEMLLSGTTTFCDGYFFEDSTAMAAHESGIRAVLGQGIVDFPAPGVPDPGKNVEEAQRFIRDWKARSPRVEPGIFCHSPYTCSEETLRRARRLADDTETLFQIHVSETQSEVSRMKKEQRLSPVQYLNRIGVLNSQTLAGHCIWVDEEDMACLAAAGVAVSVTTESEMKLASGIAPLPGLLKHGISVGLGTDGCASNNDLDLFQEMDVTAKLHKVRSMDPTVMSARQVLSLATIGGATAIGLGDKIGSLEEKKRADVIVIDIKKPHLTPLYDPVSQAVYAVRGSDVRDVIVDGHLVVENRTLLTMNLDEVMEDVLVIARKISAWSRDVT